MLRMLSATLLVAGAVPDVSEEPPRGSTNLNAPGVLEAVRVSNAAHYWELQRQISAVSDRCGGCVLLTTYPPQRDVVIEVDGKRYDARVTVERGGGRVYQTKRQPG